MKLDLPKEWYENHATDEDGEIGVGVDFSGNILCRTCGYPHPLGKHLDSKDFEKFVNAVASAFSCHLYQTRLGAIVDSTIERPLIHAAIRETLWSFHEHLETKRRMIEAATRGRPCHAERLRALLEEATHLFSDAPDNEGSWLWLSRKALEELSTKGTGGL